MIFLSLCEKGFIQEKKSFKFQSFKKKGRKKKQKLSYYRLFAPVKIQTIFGVSVKDNKKQLIYGENLNRIEFERK